MKGKTVRGDLRQLLNRPKLNRLSKECHILRTLQSIWCQSPTCRAGFISSRKTGPLATLRYLGRMVLAVVTWSNCPLSRQHQRDKGVLSFMHTHSGSSNLMFDVLSYKLEQAASERTEKDLRVTLIALREIPCFAEYPTLMQAEICRLAWYQRVEPKRVIIKEGQQASNFYIILSGAVVVTEWNRVTRSSQTKCILRQGMEFGEQAVLRKGSRSATVISYMNTELLCVTGEDMAAIYMCGREAAITPPTILHFLSQLSFLTAFPLHLLHLQPEALLYHHFQKGQVLVRNSCQSEWIYIVRSGRLQVISRLKRGKHAGTQAKGEGVFAAPTYKRRRGLRPAPHAHEETLQKLMKRQKELLHSIYSKSHAVENSQDTSLKDKPAAKTNHLPPLVEDKLSVLARLDAAGRRSPFLPEEHGAFIIVCKLEKGQFFGLTSELFNSQPSLSLVSDDADCLVLSKRFFFNHCSEHVINQLRESELPYPTEDELQRRFHQHLRWLEYKDKHYNDVLQRTT